MGLFGTDVVTDWLNGSNLIQEGHVVLGWVMALLPFLPGAVVGIYTVWYFFHGKEYRNFFITLLLYVPGVVLVTPVYMGFIIFTICVKFFKPDLDDEDEVLCGIKGKAVKGIGPMWRMGEIVGESYPQSMLGNFILKLVLF